MLRLLTSLILACALSAQASVWTADSIASTFANRRLDPIEGVWQLPGDGATLLIRQSLPGVYAIVLLESPRLDVEPGIEIGRATAAATAGRYDAQLDSKPISHSKIKKPNAVLTVNADGRLTFEPYARGKKVSLRRWISHFFRITITDQRQPSALIGARRLYPVTPQSYHPIL